MSLFDDTEIIHKYTRADALRDGELVDVTEEASHEKGFFGGFAVPVAITRSLYETLNNIPQTLCCCQDLRGRLHDVLFMGANALRKAQRDHANVACFSVIVSDEASLNTQLDLFLCVSPGDEGEPVVTVGYPEDF